MTPNSKHTQSTLDRQVAQETFRAFVQEQVRPAIRATFIDILEEEVTQFIGAERYERTGQLRSLAPAGLVDRVPSG
jgi:putative transposase